MPTPSTTTPCVCTTVRKAGRALMRHYEASVAATGITITQFAILRALQRAGSMPLSRLAEELIMERTTLYRDIRPLVDSGLVSIAPAAKGRSKLAGVTSAGRRAIARVEPHWRSAQDTVVGHIGADEWQSMSRLLLMLSDELEQSR